MNPRFFSPAPGTSSPTHYGSLTVAYIWLTERLTIARPIVSCRSPDTPSCKNHRSPGHYISVPPTLDDDFVRYRAINRTVP